MKDQAPLRIISYLVPGLPVELFETIAHYLEAVLNRPSLLIYESRYTGPHPKQHDPFRSNTADLAFLTGASYQQLVKENNTDWELLPVGSVHLHPVKGEVTGYYSDVIIHKNSKERIKDFMDLRGANWATNSTSSTSGHFVMLKTLKEYGENPSFFGNILDSGSHLNSIQMVATRQADVAAVDSNVLAYALSKNPVLEEDIHVFTSLGPLPAYPIMVRSSLPAEDKEAICEALLKVKDISSWSKRLASLRLLRFEKISKDIYLADRETRESLANLSASVCYY